MRLVYRNRCSWRKHNRKVLERKNLVRWQTGTAAIAFCPWCEELLIWFDLDKEADTFALDTALLKDFINDVQPAIDAFHRVQIEAMAAVAAGAPKPMIVARPELATDPLRLAYGSIIVAAQRLGEKHASRLKPKSQ